MSTCAVLYVRDEADIITATLDHRLIRKVRNGIQSYAAAGDDSGWAPWKGLSDEQIAERFYSHHTALSRNLVHDPVA